MLNVFCLAMENLLNVLNSMFSVYCILFLTYIAAAAGHMKLSVFEGDEVVLPCRENMCDADLYFQCPHTAEGCSVEPKMMCSLGTFDNGYANWWSVVKGGDGVCSLKLRNAKKTDTGKYTCIGNGGHGRHEIVQLNVFDISIAVPRFTYAVFVGDEVILTCAVDTPGIGIDIWYQRKPGDEHELACSLGQIVNGFVGRFLLDRSRDTEQHLVIKSIRASDSGLYTFDVKPGQSILTSFCINVYETANDSSSDVVLEHTSEVGQLIEMQCRPISQTPSVSWHYQSSSRVGMRKISSTTYIYSAFADNFYLNWTSEGNYNLVIRRASFNESGNYICIEDFDNNIGRRTTVHLKVNERRYPVYRIAITAFVGDTVALPCHVAVDRPVKWLYQDIHQRHKQGSSITAGPGTRYYVDSSLPIFQNLIIADVHRKDARTYTCTEESGDVAEHQVTLTVLARDAPTTKLQQTVRLEKKKTTILPCTLNEKNGSHVSWWHVNPKTSELSEVARSTYVLGAYHAKFSVDRCSLKYYNLTARNLESADSGDYMCIEDFGDGFGRQTIVSLDVIGVKDKVVTGAEPSSGLYSTGAILSFTVMASLCIISFLIAIIIASCSSKPKGYMPTSPMPPFTGTNVNM